MCGSLSVRRSAIGLLAWLSIASLATAQSVGPSKDAPTPARGNSRLALDLFQLMRNRPGNLCFSPVGIEAVLDVLRDGARGTFRDELDRLLSERGGKLDEKTRRAVLSGNRVGLQVSNATCLWGQTGWDYNSEFITRATQKGFTLKTVDFERNLPTVISEINQWVSQQTQGKIPRFFSNDLDETTKILVTNAVYFRATWDLEFNQTFTMQKDFHLRNGKLAKVDFMRQVATYRAWKSKLLQIVELPYQGDDFSAFALSLNPEGATQYQLRREELLEKFEQQLTETAWQATLSRLKPTLVALELPRFQIADSLEVLPLLNNLGAKSIPAGEFNLSGVFAGDRSAPPLSQFVQKSIIQVDEKGTEAAAATAAGASSGTSSPIPFVFDSPFLFLVLHRETGLILFLARVDSPQPPVREATSR
jgi:serpin B